MDNFLQMVPIEGLGKVDFFTVSQKISTSKLAAANEKEQMKARKAFYKEAKVNEQYLKICEFLGNPFLSLSFRYSSFKFFSQEGDSNSYTLLLSDLLVLWIVPLLLNCQI